MQQFAGIFDWVYMFSTTFIVAIVLTYVIPLIPNRGLFSVLAFLKKEGARFWVSAVIGILWGILIAKLRGSVTEQLIVSYLLATWAHKGLLKYILRFMRLEDTEEKRAAKLTND